MPAGIGKIAADFCYFMASSSKYFIQGKYLAAILLALFFMPRKIRAQEGVDLLEKTYHAISDIQTVSYTVHLKERVDGKLSEERTGNIKMTVKPLQVYYFMILPRYGAELLYNSKAYGNNIYINPNGFPWFSFNLDPDNKWMRKSRHHTILDAGFEYIKDILGRFLAQSHNLTDFKISNPGKQKINNIDCLAITIEKEVFFYKNYTMKEGEDISEFARKEGLSDFMVLERNPKYEWYDSPKPGETLVVPNFYAKKVAILVDPSSFLPVSLQIFDDIGLFEEVTFSDINIHPVFNSDTFSIENPDYGF